jgi:succinylglutamic semialdehyde dehydrogenase
MKLSRVVRGSYLQGHFVKVSDPNGEVISRNPGNLEEPSVSYPYSFEHVQEAISAARSGFRSWKRIAPKERCAAILKYSQMMKQRQEEIAVSITFETGKPLWEAREEVNETLTLIEYYLSVGSQTTQQIEVAQATDQSHGVVRFLPRGVMAIVTSPYLPIRLSHAQMIPALINGNCVVLMGAPETPATVQLVAEMFHEAALPSGVLNMVQGEAEVTRRLLSHAEIDGIFFSGSYDGTAKFQKVLTDYWKVTVVEMRGKNGLVVWDDCDYQKALHEALYSAFVTTGQRTVSCDRILIHTKIFDRFVHDFHELAKKCKIGYGMTDGKDAPFMGPLLSEEALEQYLRHQGIAVREGCEEVMRGKSLERSPKGYYVSPSIHLVTKADPKSVYQKTEIMGPNVGLYPVSDLDEAAEVLNQTQYGMVAAIYSGARENYLRLIEDVSVGHLHWNRPTVEVSYRLPYGGIKKSGNSRPMGSYAANQLTFPVGSLEAPGSAEGYRLPAQVPRLGG